MTRHSKNILILLIVTLVAILGYASYVFLHTEENARDHKTLTKTKGYVAAPPHYGPIVVTKDINIRFKNVVGYAELNLDNLQDIRIGQDVVLYDREGFALPLGGEVQIIEKNKKSANLTIKLPPGTNTELLAGKSKIIIMQTTASKRMPLSALQEDETGQAYVWIASKNDQENQYRLRRQDIIIGTRNNEYFEEGGFFIQANDLVLHNPDNKIKPDQTYKIQEIDFTAPLHNPIKQAWIDFEINYLRQQQTRLRQEAQDCLDGKTDAPKEDYVGADSSTTPDGSASGSCGNAANFAEGTDPLSVFKYLTRPNAEATGACGNANASCPQ